MASNLVSLAMKVLTPDLVMKIAAGLGLDKSLAQKAIAAAVPAILAGLAGKAGKPDGARSIVDALDKQDAGLLGSLAGMIGGSSQGSLINSGTTALTTLLGGSAIGALTGALAKYAGVGETPAKSLVGLMGPVVLGTLGQEKRSGKLDPAGLTSLLSAQREHITAAMPGEFVKLLGGSSLLDAVKDQIATPAAGSSSTSSGPAPPARKVEMPGKLTTSPAAGRAAVPVAPWWRLPLIATAALGLGWSMFGVEPPPGLTTGPAAPQRVLVDGVDIGGLAAGALDGLRTTLGNVRDSGGAQAALPKLLDSAAQLDRVSALAAKLPADARRTLAGTVAAANSSMAPIFTSVLALPGVAPVLKPTLDTVRAKLDVLSRT